MIYGHFSSGMMWSGTPTLVDQLTRGDLIVFSVFDTPKEVYKVVTTDASQSITGQPMIDIFFKDGTYITFSNYVVDQDTLVVYQP